MSVIRSLEDALSPIADGCLLAVPREQAGVAMEATRALIRRQHARHNVKNLHLVALPDGRTSALLSLFEVPAAERPAGRWRRGWPACCPGK